MIKDSEKRLFDIVLVWKLDRFARNRFDSAHYEYLLEREENGIKRVVYRGKRQKVFADTVEEGKTYEYSVTPCYKDILGDTVFLPSVTTKNNFPAGPSEPPGIIGKDWWNY